MAGDNLNIKFQISESERKALLKVVEEIKGLYPSLIKLANELYKLDKVFDFFLKGTMSYYHDMLLPLEKIIKSFPSSYFHSSTDFKDISYNMGQFIINVRFLLSDPISRKYFYRDDFPKAYFLEIRKPILKKLIALVDVELEMMERIERQMVEYLRDLEVDKNSLHIML